MIRVFRANSANIRTVRVFRKNAAVFREEDHPRDKSGRFGKGDGGAKKSEEKAPLAEKKTQKAKVESLGEKTGTPRQPSKNIDEIYKLTAASQKDFSDFTEKYAKKYGGTIEARKELKSRERVAQKIAEEPEKGTDGIVDIDAKTIIVNDLDSLNNLYADLLADENVVRAKNRFANPTGAGYRDILANVRMPNGAVVELQVSTPQMLEAKDLCHSLYEIERELAIGIEGGRATQSDFAVHDKLQKIQEKVYSAAWDASLSDASFKASDFVKGDAQYLKSVETILGRGFNDLSDKTKKHFSEFLSTAYGKPSESKNSSPGESTVNAAMVSTSVKSVAQKENINKFRIFRASR